MVMITPSESSVTLAVYGTHIRADEAVKALREHVLGYFNTGDRMKSFGTLGAFCGGLASILFGSAMMFVPVVGNVIILSPLAATLFGGPEGAAPVGGLTAIGVPENAVLRYETALKADRFLPVLNADAAQVRRAPDVLGSDLDPFGRPNA